MSPNDYAIPGLILGIACSILGVIGARLLRHYQLEKTLSWIDWLALTAICVGATISWASAASLVNILRIR